MTSRLFLLPGMGASANMYQGVWQSLPGACFLNWPLYKGESTLAEVADRVVAENSITPADRIGGSSLGGMVATEIFKKLHNPRLVLLGSAVHVQEVKGWLRFLAPASRFVPFRGLQTLVKNSSHSFLRMYAEADPRFIRAMCRAVMTWQGFQGAPQLFRIHGHQDSIIACPLSGAHVIPNAGHFIAMTHAEQCVQVIANHCK